MTDNPTQSPAGGELKPCPFCGGEASVHQDNDYSTGKPVDRWWVQCTPCDMFPEAAWCKPIDEAIAAWNNRAVLAASQPARDEVADRDSLRKQIKALKIPNYVADYSGNTCSAGQGFTDAIEAVLAILPAAPTPEREDEAYHDARYDFAGAPRPAPEDAGRVERLVLAAERVSRKYGHDDEGPIDWSEWAELRDALSALHPVPSDGGERL